MKLPVEITPSARFLPDSWIFTPGFTGQMWLGLLLLAILLATGCGPTGNVVATIDGHDITVAELNEYLKGYHNDDIPASDTTTPAEFQAEPRADLRAALDQLIDEYLLQLAARRRGWLQEDEKSLQKRRQAEERVLEELGRQVPWPSPQEAREYYQQHPEEFKTGTRYQLEHLLFSSEHSAWEIREKVVAGQLTLADAGRRGLGGAHLADCDRKIFVTAEELPTELSRALARLKPGQVSQVIASPYGYHLVRIIRQKPAGAIPFVEIENRIKDTIFAERLRKNHQNWLKQQKKEYIIRIFPEHLKNL